MDRVKFDPKEMEPIGYIPSFPGAPPIPRYNSPITCRENYRLMVSGQQPLWMVHADELTMFSAPCIPDSWARGMITSDKPVDRSKVGGKDMFGVEWEWVPESAGSMVRPDKHPVKDLSHWEDYITKPDVDSWDWAGGAEDTRIYRSADRIIRFQVVTGLFERLISFVGMNEAMMAMIDEDEQEHVHRLFDYLCTLYDQMFAKIKEHFDPDCIMFHDDWGSQRAPFFSLDTVQEMIVPYLKRIVESSHKYGMPFELHSCGKNELLLPAMIEAGCDMWNGQDMNDKLMLAKKYGDKIIVDSAPEPLPPDADEETVRANVQKYLDDFKGLRTFACMRFVKPMREYAVMYELSRKAFNP